LTPEEIERLNGFPEGWTEGLSDARRAFLMGNALVVGIVEMIGPVIQKRLMNVMV
jgi:DNA (cytosine-5)-methyltransferase 1